MGQLTATREFTASAEDAEEAKRRLVESGVLDRFPDRHGPNVVVEENNLTWIDGLVCERVDIQKNRDLPSEAFVSLSRTDAGWALRERVADKLLKYGRFHQRGSYG